MLMKKLLLIAGIIMFYCANAFAAPGNKCTGIVVDDQHEAVIGATVTVPGTSTAVSTDIDGKFSIEAAKGQKIKIVYIGYKPVTLNAEPNMGTIELEVEAQMLQDVVITQSVAKTRVTPVAQSVVNAEMIDVKLGNQELPEILKTTPGVWTTRDGGGFGDAKTNMRGFKSPNVAVVINGVPINDMEWGGVYWSNWAGLSDVTSNMQTQRGLGATIVSTPSVGGTISINTRTIDVERGGSVWYGMGNDGLNNYGVKVSTGLMKNGWAVTVLGSRKWGDGYVQGTPFNSYNYFINVSKRINDKHQIALTAFGAPQSHYKRSSNDGLSVEGWQNVKNYMNGESMYKFNPTFGYDKDGKWRNSNYNYYHKPQIMLKHVWQIDETQSLSSVAYVSFASGYGYSGQGSGRNGYAYSDWYGASNGNLNTKFRRADGTFDYAAIQEINEASTTGSELIMSKSNNSHKWVGLVSSYKKDIKQKNGNKLALIGGLDLRYYIGEHNNEIVDLYNGEYFIDSKYRAAMKTEVNANAANPEWVYKKLGVGDVVYRDYNGYTLQEGVYAQGEYTMLDGKLNLVMSGALNNTAYWRRDFYYYDKQHEKSETVNFWGGTIKGGVNYNLDKKNNVFFNAGFISRAPFFSGGAFLSSTNSNAINSNAVNEKVMSFEVGYGLHTRPFALTFNAYYTRWMDRTTTRGGDIKSGELAGQRYFFNMEGVDARHMGLEMNFNWVPAQWISIDGMLSWGDWQWDSDASGYFYSQLGEPITKDFKRASGIGAPDHLRATLLQKGVKVGGSAQTTGALGVNFKPFKGFRIGADWTMSARNYSDYQVQSTAFENGGDITVAEPWRIPWGQQFDLSASYRFNIGGVKATLYGNVYNLFNYNYIMDAYTSTDTDGAWDNAYRIFYSFGRTYSIRMRINF